VSVQGCWRKVVIDDLMPFDHEGNLLLPATSLSHELWPMLLTKALLKVAALELVISLDTFTCSVGPQKVNGFLVVIPTARW